MKEDINLSKSDDKDDKYYLKRDLLIVGIILFFVLLYFAGTQKDAISEFFLNTFWSMKPNSVAHFQKATRPNNEEVICAIAGDTTDIKNTFFTYTKNTIRIYDSLGLTNLINSVNIKGEIIDIHCYYIDNFDMYDYMQNDNDKDIFTNGMFVFCEYNRDKTNRLICFNIGRINYESFEDVKFYKDKYGPNEDNVRKHYLESMNSIANKFDNDHSTKIINKYTEVLITGFIQQKQSENVMTSTLVILSI